MKSSVIIKGNQYGIILVLDSEMEFSELKEQIALKFKESARFFGDAKLGISFEGRFLTTGEQKEILDIISQNCELHIICIMDQDKKSEENFKKCLNDKLTELENNTGQFYKGNLRSGQVLEFNTSIIVIGDVNPGAKVVSKGNIIILGALKGNVYAGAAGNENAFVVALDMNPMQIRIADMIARSPDKPTIKRSKLREVKIAFIEENAICIESISRKILRDINIG